MTFKPESIWLKDYYVSRVALEVKEGINEGIVRIKVNDTNSSHLYIASDQDDSGLTPPRFHADMDEDMHGELRNPRQAVPNVDNSGLKTFGGFNRTQQVGTPS